MKDVKPARELRVGDIVMLLRERVRGKVRATSECCLSDFLPEHLQKYARRAPQIAVDLDLEEPIENPLTRWKQTAVRIPLDPDQPVAYMRRETR